MWKFILISSGFVVLAEGSTKDDSDIVDLSNDVVVDSRGETETNITSECEDVVQSPPSLSWFYNSTYNAGEDYTVYSTSYADDSLEKALADFGQRFYGHLARRNGRENFVFSPLSLHSALSMLYVGATPGSDTFSELQDSTAPGINKTDELLYDYKLVTDFYQNQTSFKYGNKIWVSKGFEIEEDYKNMVYKNLDAETEQADFSLKDTRERINKWVSKKTGGQIKKLVDEFSPDTKLFIANALHFKEAWEIPFNEFDLHGNTLGEEDFYVVNDDGLFEKVAVPMMFQVSSDIYRYGFISTPRDSSVEVVAIPYKNINFEMQLLIPSDNTADALDKLEEEMQEDQVFNIFSYPKNINDHVLVEDISIKMPRFKIEKSVDAAEIFQSMGIKQAFIDAELSKLSKDSLVADRVVHKAAVEVTPLGTEGSAATGIQLVPLSASNGVNMDFVINRPFIFVVQDVLNNIPILVGRVADPRSQPVMNRELQWRETKKKLCSKL